MKISQAGIDLIRQFEGCRLKSYQDIVGVWTIGFGATGGDVYEGLEWTQDQANRRLEADLLEFEEGVTAALKVPVNDGQFSALVSFAYNLGLATLKKSTLFRLVNSSDFDGAAAQFVRWNRAGGVEVPGLTRRRRAEQALFES